MEGYLGEIRYFAGSFAPHGWAFCQGQTLLIDSNQSLFSIIGYSYTPGAKLQSTTFNLPDLRGKTAIGAGQAKGLSNYALGSTTGTETVTLTEAQMPLHTHNTEASIGMEISLETASLAITDDPQSASLGYISPNTGSITPYAKTANEKMKPFELDVDFNTVFHSSGSGLEHGNMQPYSVVHYIICINGYYPQLSQ